MANNLCYIYEEHHLTNCARCAVNRQQSEEWNYVVIECYSNRGLYKWHGKDRNKWEIWTNNKLNCYCVPMSELIFVSKLEDLKDEKMRKRIRKDQLDYWNGAVKNSTPHINKEPVWLLPV